jgi:hypothetical protein
METTALKTMQLVMPNPDDVGSPEVAAAIREHQRLFDMFTAALAQLRELGAGQTAATKRTSGHSPRRSAPETRPAGQAQAGPRCQAPGCPARGRGLALAVDQTAGVEAGGRRPQRAASGRRRSAARRSRSRRSRAIAHLSAALAKAAQMNGVREWAVTGGERSYRPRVPHLPLQSVAPGATGTQGHRSRRCSRRTHAQRWRLHPSSRTAEASEGAEGVARDHSSPPLRARSGELISAASRFAFPRGSEE